jgi:sugar lactone lactonase YvrE
VSKVEHTLAVQNVLGEGPVWDVDEQALYWVDIVSNCYFRLHPATGALERVEVGVPIGVLALRASGGLVMAVRDGFAFWDPQKKELSYVAKPEEGKQGMRFNDGAVDPAGRFWAGSTSYQQVDPIGTLWRLDPDGSVHAMVRNVTVSNGIGWSPDNTIMYFIDSPTRTISVFDYDLSTGDIANRRNFVQTLGEEAAPDGLTVDSEGFVWCAYWGAAKVVRYDPAGRVERVIPTPALFTTACVFGGPDLSDLYITSARTGLSTEQLSEYPQSGDLFCVHTDCKGQPKYRFGG